MNVRKQHVTEALGAVLTPEQHEKVKSYVEDRIESIKNR